MAELTRRETIITHMFLFLLNPDYKQVPYKTKLKMALATLKVRNIDTDEGELEDIFQALEAEKNLSISTAIGFVDKFGGILNRK